jgi:hypothetical protein
LRPPWSHTYLAPLKVSLVWLTTENHIKIHAVGSRHVIALDPENMLSFLVPGYSMCPSYSGLEKRWTCELLRDGLSQLWRC